LSGRGALKTVFPRLYSLSVAKASAMAAFGGLFNENGSRILSGEGIYLNERSN